MKYRFPIPHLDDMLDVVVVSTILSSNDLKKVYHRVTICVVDERKTIIKTNDGSYE